MFVAPPAETEAVRAHYQAARADDGYLMNLERLWSWRLEVHEAFAAARRALVERTSLSPRERAVVVCATVSEMGDAYCSLAWGARLAREAGADAAARVLAGEEPPALTDRERELARWARRVVEDACTTTPADVDSLRAAGLSEQEIVDATMLIGFRVAFSTVNDALGARPDRELAEAAPPEVLRAVSFGRPVDGAPLPRDVDSAASPPRWHR